MAYPGILQRLLNHLADYLAHGATPSATAGRIALRDTNGRMQAADPAADLDVVNKRSVVSLAGGVGSTRKINTALPLEGGGDLSIDRTLSVALATESAPGVVQLATAAEAAAGTAINRAVTPAGIAAAVAGASGTPTPSQNSGIGQWTSFESQLPPGGTWAYFALSFVNDPAYGYPLFSNKVAGVAAGGTKVLEYSNGREVGFCWRIA